MEKAFNHDKASTADKIFIVAELEHIRRHALRSATSLYDSETSRPTDYLILAHQARELRREYMTKNFPDISDQDWCLCKAAASLRQLAYETAEIDTETLKEIDNLVDDIWEMATGEDLSDCAACKEDKAVDTEDIDTEE